MNYTYIYFGIGFAIVIIGAILLLHVESTNSNNPFITPIYPLTMTIVDSRPSVIHVGELFALDASVTNPNFHTDIPTSNISITTTFVPNVVHDYHFFCSGLAECNGPSSFGYGDTLVPIPYLGSGNPTFLANSAGEINATVNIQYYIDGRAYNTTASKVFTVLPIINHYVILNGTMFVAPGPYFSVNYTIVNGKIIGIKKVEPANAMIVTTRPAGTGVLNIQLPETLDFDISTRNPSSFLTDNESADLGTPYLSSWGKFLYGNSRNGTFSVDIQWTRN